MWSQYLCQLITQLAPDALCLAEPVFAAQVQAQVLAPESVQAQVLASAQALAPESVQAQVLVSAQALVPESVQAQGLVSARGLVPESVPYPADLIPDRLHGLVLPHRQGHPLLVPLPPLDSHHRPMTHHRLDHQADHCDQPLTSALAQQLRRSAVALLLAQSLSQQVLALLPLALLLQAPLLALL